MNQSGSQKSEADRVGNESEKRNFEPVEKLSGPWCRVTKVCRSLLFSGGGRGFFLPRRTRT